MAPSIVRSAPTLKYFSYSDASTTTRTDGSPPSSVNASASSCIRSSAIELLPLRCITTRAIAPSRLTSTHSPIGGLRSKEGYAACDCDDGSSDVPGLVRAKERDRVRNVIRLAETLEHRPLFEALIHRVVFGRCLAGLALDDACGDRVRRYVVPPTFEGCRFRQPDDRGLGRRVAGLADPAERSGDG